MPISSASTDAYRGVDDLRPAVEAGLIAACNFGDGCPTRLADAMRYAVLAPGKRLRPLLVLMAAEACGGMLGNLTDSAIAEVMPGAVAVEMIHAYSLIHDDLPAMDDDDLRRGRPTVHIEFDEAIAILAGDALQAEAFAQIANHVRDPQRAIEATRILAKAAGAAHLVGGQADDLMAETDPMGVKGRTVLGSSPEGGESSAALLASLQSIHRRKTGALFSASLDLGAVLSGASEEARASLGRYAEHLGLAFQVTDDNLDYTADTDTLGKRAGKDADRGKLTYPGLLGIEASREKARELIEASKREALFFADSAERLLWLADYVLERTN
ncbi:Farnesyl diphosphate synthase [Rubripirellula amarantea]|uniref:Farnesyl diphosphate synthase n=1 Tax=Rubripirellula amarantea TaxID=2527999 RepID=A0A5C5WED0_9BACT|nr:polyprenyl synthetase family protein [Rubripirellula amarantea]TWT49094.1 Farnesyl diphosphate synthase [Rubripirellula amarantea]